MEIPPLPAPPVRLAIRPLTGRDEAGPVAPRPSTAAPAADRLPRLERVSGHLGFEVDHRAPGVNIARLVDVRTGAVVVQLPPEGVLQQVSEIIETIRRKET